ncbi:MAG: ribulose-phosphate 3-epimerase [Actinobacteria bacterium]|jgi:ribulose-phosphate 3-epimerase|uniref:ribulose-phosphate 3-epimerase n=1 Tax=freshwater metagenome TaxID=449393 RepID=A0A6J6K4R5_9ZZZZ|nr:ribulose-phosphate 3-epimerase [Actinomycetota bacterium]MSZ22809.1 ribulose-phosphate 3-epimerase [Actinomycetota bacterium]MTA91779.1 ribulose-phosphate 3-epimerase [Actinomycetota bacterium]
MEVRINPSILAADFVNLESELGTIANSDFIHVDVMDNHFVPNLTFGTQMVQRLQEVSPVGLDVHLMISNVDNWAMDYVQMGVHSVTFHAEASADYLTLARRIRDSGSRAGVAIKPGTALEPYLEHLDEIDQLLIMTVEPGFGGQSLIETTLKKVKRAREAIAAAELPTWLQVDGGINASNIQRVASFGADTFVAGSAVFSSHDRASTIADLRRSAATGLAEHQAKS